MTKYVHIVQVHPVENGEPNLYKVVHEEEFLTEAAARKWIEIHGAFDAGHGYKAVYHGRVNDATGELE